MKYIIYKPENTEIYDQEKSDSASKPTNHKAGNRTRG